jgi:hypothetical protein
MEKPTVIKQKNGQSCYDLVDVHGKYRCAHCGGLLQGTSYSFVNGKRVIKGSCVFSNPAWGICVPVHKTCKIPYARMLSRLMEEQEDARD